MNQFHCCVAFTMCLDTRRVLPLWTLMHSITLSGAGRDVLTLLQRSQDLLDNTQTQSSALNTSSSFDIFVGVFYVCHCFFTQRYLFSFCNCCTLSRVRSIINPPNLLAVNPSGIPLLCSHIDWSWISTDIVSGGQTEKVRRNWAADLLGQLRSHMQLLLRKYGGLVHVWKLKVMEIVFGVILQTD